MDQAKARLVIWLDASGKPLMWSRITNITVDLVGAVYMDDHRFTWYKIHSKNFRNSIVNKPVARRHLRASHMHSLIKTIPQSLAGVLHASCAVLVDHRDLRHPERAKAGQGSGLAVFVNRQFATSSKFY